MRNQRPKIIFPHSSFERTLNVVAATSILVSIVLVMAFWDKIPEVIPLHFNLLGAIDNSGPKYNLIVLISVVVIFYSSMNLLARFPQYFNYPVTITERNALEKYKLARTLVHLINFMTTVFLSIFILILLMEAPSFMLPSAIIYACLSVFTSLIYIIKLYKDQ